MYLFVDLLLWAQKRKQLLVIILMSYFDGCTDCLIWLSIRPVIRIDETLILRVLGLMCIYSLWIYFGYISTILVDFDQIIGAKLLLWWFKQMPLQRVFYIHLVIWISLSVLKIELGESVCNNITISFIELFVPFFLRISLREQVMKNIKFFHSLFSFTHLLFDLKMSWIYWETAVNLSPLY